MHVPPIDQLETAEPQPSQVVNDLVPALANPITSFEHSRSLLLHRIFIDSSRGIPFDDTCIYAYSAQSKKHFVHNALPVYTRSDFLREASSVFATGAQSSLHTYAYELNDVCCSEIYGKCLANGSQVTRPRSCIAEYDYESDSDLKDSEEPEESEGTCKRIFTSKEIDGAIRVDRKGSMSVVIGVLIFTTHG